MQKFPLPWEGGHPFQILPQVGRSAPSQFSSEDRSLGFLNPPPPPPKNVQLWDYKRIAL